MRLLVLKQSERENISIINSVLGVVGKSAILYLNKFMFIYFINIVHTVSLSYLKKTMYEYIDDFYYKKYKTI